MPDYYPDDMLLIHDRITQRMQARYKRRVALFLHTIIAIVFSWYFLSLNRGDLIFIWVLTHLFHYGIVRLADNRDKAIARELERFGLHPYHQAPNEKVKHEQIDMLHWVALSDDGEPIEYNTQRMQARHKRQASRSPN